jgi:hypothetical protein
MQSKIKLLLVMSILLSGCVLGTNWRDRNKNSIVSVEYGVFGGYRVQHDDNGSYCSYLKTRQLFGDQLIISFTVHAKRPEALEYLKSKKFRVVALTDDFGETQLEGERDNVSIAVPNSVTLLSKKGVKKGTTRLLDFAVMEANDMIYYDCIIVEY